MRAAFILLLIVPLLSLYGCRPAAPPISVSNKPVTADDTAAMKPLGEMSWTDQDGRVQKLSDLKGKAVILDFWATYCPPCIEEIPHLNSLLEKYGTDKLHIVGLNVGGAEDKPKIAGFVEKTRMSYPVAFPENDLTRFVFASRDDIPQTAVFDRNGVMVTKIVGFNDKVRSELDAAVEKAVAGN